MKFLLRILIPVFTMLITLSARADIVVLVHGYLGSPASWDNSAISKQLQQAGWQKAGVIFDTPQGAMLRQHATSSQNNIIYSLLLPSRAPLVHQAELLQRMISDLEKRHPDESIVIIGHSAGGVVARVKLVRYGAGNVSKLITIASPHLGTGLASYALNETHSGGPVGFLKGFFGGEKYDIAKSSTPLLVDLVPARPGSFLNWLNHQPHPEIEYVSVIRGKDAALSGDSIVPGHSQDMNEVFALRGKSQRYYLPTSHGLNPLDGDFLSVLLEDNLRK